MEKLQQIYLDKTFQAHMRQLRQDKLFNCAMWEQDFDSSDN